jgi:hypothetical protein
MANWYTRPQAAWAWAAAIVMLLVMIAALLGSRTAFRRLTSDATSLRSRASVTSAVAFGALMMVIPLGTTLAFSYGIVEDPDVGKRATMIIQGAFLAVLGNAMPRMLPPLAQMACDGARTQHFLRLAGWIWVLGGLAFSLAWLTLSVDTAQTVSITAIAGSVVLTIALLLRLRWPRRRSPLPE